MPKFGEKSLERLATCHEELQELCFEAIKVVDFAVLCGHRDKEAQERAFSEGFSKLEWPKSSHNKTPSNGIDVAPWPIDWNNRERFFYLGGVMTGLARKMNIELVWGGAWLGTLNKKGGFDDLGHFERMESGCSRR